MSYVIEKLYIKNFKSITEVLLENMNQDLIIFDGPNGFGKTSLFDAIELVLTKNIRRISDMKISKGNKGFNDYLIAKEQDKPVILKLQITNKETSLSTIIGRKINVVGLTSIQKKPSEFVSTIHLLDSIEEELKADNEVDEQIEGKLGEMKDSFRFFNYIEQENSSHFFKNEEQERMNEISKLFNIEKENSELIKLKKINGKLKNYLSKEKQELTNMKAQVTSKVNNEIEYEEVVYHQMLPNNINKIEIWDHEVIPNFTIERKKELFKRIDSFSYLIDNFSELKKLMLNDSLTALKKNPEKIKSLLIKVKLDEKKDIIIKEYDTKIKLNNIKSNLTERIISREKVDYRLLYEIFEFPISNEELLARIERIDELKKGSTYIANTMDSLIAVRKKMISDFKIISNDSEKSCPLCGHNHDSYNELIDEINKQTEKLMQQLNSSSKKINDALETLYKEVFNELISKIDKHVNTLIKDENFEVYSKYLETKINIDKALTFFNDLNINLNSFFYENTNDFSDLEKKAEEVERLLEQNMEKNVKFDLDYYETTKDIFENTLAKNEEILNSIDFDHFKSKKSYLNYQYSMYLNELEEKYTKREKKYSKLLEYFNSVARTIEIYEKEINKYRTSMMKEIEIPFYLYSGKIIQNYQRGVGVFIKEENNKTGNRIMRLVPNNTTEHDVVHSFSSGQLSATVIAFTLAINKVYGNNQLNTLLIDDPVQTMDEINMASFIELLRNDFGDNQIILSTHSNHVSLYMRYKFSKYGFDAKNVNVKEELV